VVTDAGVVGALLLAGAGDEVEGAEIGDPLDEHPASRRAALTPKPAAKAV